MCSPRLHPCDELGTPAAPPPETEQIRGHQAPTPATTHARPHAHTHTHRLLLEQCRQSEESRPTAGLLAECCTLCLSLTWKVFSAVRRRADGGEFLLSINTVRPFSLDAGLMTGKVRGHRGKQLVKQPNHTIHWFQPLIQTYIKKDSRGLKQKNKTSSFLFSQTCCVAFVQTCQYLTDG